MTAEGFLLLLELVGVFAFALDGALTAMRSTHLDLFGVVALGIVTAVGDVTPEVGSSLNSTSAPFSAEGAETKMNTEIAA